MAYTQKQERFAVALTDLLNLKLATTTDPTPAVKSYAADAATTGTDIIVTVTFGTGNNAIECIIRFTNAAAPVNGKYDSLGLPQTVYTPGLTKVVFDKNVSGTPAGSLGGVAAKVRYQVLAALCVGQRVEVFEKDAGAGNLAVADSAVAITDASFVTAIESMPEWGPQAAI